MTTTHVHGPACAARTDDHAVVPRTVRRGPTRRAAFTLLATLAAVTAWVLVRNPLQTTVFPPCPFRAATGLWCPGCGATRASYLLLHGDVGSALHFNAMWVILAPFALYQAVAFAGEACGVRWLRRIPVTQPVMVALGAAVVGFALVRNLPFETFGVLNPVSTS